MKTKVTTVKQKVYTITKSVRFKPEEWAIIEGKFAGRKWSTVFRAVLLNAPIPARTVPVGKTMSDRDRVLGDSMATIRSSFNQVARSVNTAVQNGERIAVHAALIEIHRLLDGALRYDNEDHS